MNVKKIIATLSDTYPGKKIIKNYEENPTEIICEIEPSESHPEYSVALAVIDQYDSHYHLYSVKTYPVIHGTLIVLIGNKEITLNAGDELVILPKTVHGAQGDETIVKVSSKPGWIIF